MTSTPSHKTDKTRILLDLKPALDGYAGVPQESRLLFRSLRMLDSYEVEGLIQHGARRLRSGVSRNGTALPVSKQINRLSRVVVSLYENPYSGVTGKAIYGIERYLALFLLRLRTMSRISIKPSIFASDLFDDFIWRTFFKKTLRLEDKDLLTSACYRILGPPRNLLHKAGLAGPRLSSTPRYVPINTEDFDIFVAQTPFPGRLSRKTRMVVRYHDAVPLLMAHTIKDKAFHQASHFCALQANVRAGAWFSCVSESTRTHLLKIFPEVEPRTTVIYNIVSDQYFDEDSPKELIYDVIRNRLGKVKDFTTDVSNLGLMASKGRPAIVVGKEPELDYLLMVSTIEPRKNHQLLIGAWERLKYTSMPELKLVIVGSLGWDQEPILNAFRPWAERGDLFYLSDVPSSELRVLYKHATATICPSLAEGFDYSGIEAMKCGGIVISSDIPVHREIFSNASEYFSPYSAKDAAMVIRYVIAKENLSIRERLREAGALVSERYTPQNILPKWDELFQMLKRP